jgi:Tol biopolymer transport system component/DNA-binding winged helix-turn-helix (wHTH) protein
MPDQVLRFGTFELDVRARRLTKQGRRVRIQEQPLRLLEVLLENSGRLVTRQELAGRLWPGDVHVDVDRGLTGAMKRLRLALDDEAGNPRFIETVPKAGFRFVAPVETIVVPEPAGNGPPADSGAPRVEERRRGPTLRVAGFLAVPLAAIAMFALRPEMPAPRISKITKLTTTGRAWIHEPLVTDGTRLYYTELVDTQLRARQVLFDGSDDTLVPAIPPAAVVRGVTPDRSMFAIAFQSLEPTEQSSLLWLQPVDGGPARRLGSAVANDVAWSPDRRSLVFVTDAGVWIADASGAGERLVARLPHGASSPHWSPDSQLVRFTVSQTKDETSLWEVGADGRSLRPVDLGWSGPQSDSFGSWTPDDRWFVFSSRRGDASNLWAIESRTDWWHRRRVDPAQMTNGPLQYFRPLPGPDGASIFAFGIELEGSLVRYDEAHKTFVPFLGGRSVDHVSFSRDGQWAAYVAYPEGTLWRSRVDGSEALQLTPASTHAYQPQWSPDGQRIAFSVRRPGDWSKLYVVSAQGGPMTPLVSETVAQGTATWTPDGNTIIYGRDRASDPASMVLMSFDVARERAEVIPGTENLFAPVLSPDGTQIIAQAADRRALVLVDRQSGARRVLVPRQADYPAWSTDSQYVYFVAPGPVDRSVSRIRVSDGHEERVAAVPFTTRGIFGSWMGLAPDGSVLVVADRSRSDVYALSLTDR